MTNSSLQVQFCFDPGYGKSVFITSRNTARSTFHEILPQSHEIRASHFAPVEATTLQIIITGLSIGAGIVASQMLKECGKDLWKIVKKLIVPKEIQKDEVECHSPDKIQLETRIGDSSMTLTLSGIDLYSETVIKEFLTSGPSRLYEKHLAQVKS